MVLKGLFRYYSWTNERSLIFTVESVWIPESPEDIDAILTELLDFKSLPDDVLPHRGENLDQFWSALSKLTRPEDSTQRRFANLSKLAKVALVLPHSNADPERLFSMVKKNRDKSTKPPEARDHKQPHQL
eukprot:scpid64125/ scgid4510/ 